MWLARVRSFEWPLWGARSRSRSRSRSLSSRKLSLSFLPPCVSVSLCGSTLKARSSGSPLPLWTPSHLNFCMPAGHFFGGAVACAHRVTVVIVLLVVQNQGGLGADEGPGSHAVTTRLPGSP